MEERKKRCSMQLKLEIVRARNMALQPGCKGSLFVRYYLNKKIGVNSKEVEACQEPHWGETFCLECEGKGMDEMLSALTMESESVVFEVRWRRRRRIGIFGGLKSKLLGRVEVSWKEILSYPSLSINKWFPLVEERKENGYDHELPIPTSALQIAVWVTDVQSDTWIEPIKMISDSKKNSEGSRNEEERQRQRRRRRLEREECGCGGHACRAHQDVHFFGQA